MGSSVMALVNFNETRGALVEARRRELPTPVLLRATVLDHWERVVSW